MALAECQHHSAQRQKKARAREEEREMHHTAAFRTIVHPPEPELFDLFEEPGGVRPNLLLEPQGPQERVLQHTVEHAGAICPFVQILDAPVPQMTDQLPNIVQFFATHLPVVAEPVIEVPKILPHDVPTRRLCRDTQLAEQLVKVPTIVSYSLLQRTMEQDVDIPVHGGGGRRGRKRRTRLWPKLERRPGQGSTAFHGAELQEFQGLQGLHPPRTEFYNILWSRTRNSW